MNKRNKFVAFFMVCCLMLTIVGGIPENIYAEEVQAVTIQEKLDYLLERLPKSSTGKTFFTVNTERCIPVRQPNEIRETGHECKNCHNLEIVKAGWFKELFGEVDITCFPKQWYSDTEWNYNGSSCFGFACFCQWYLYADNNGENLTGEKIKTIRFNKEEVQAWVKPGDVLRVVTTAPAGHSYVVYSVEADRIWVVDCNWIGPQCEVLKREVMYDDGYAKGKITYVCRPSKAKQMESGMAGLFDMEEYEKTEPTMLKYGDSGLNVQYFQQNLNFLGYSVGTADGEYGNLTKTAVSNLQNALHMDQTGTVKSGLYDLVYGVVSEVQYYLKAKSYYTMDVDGVSGPGTETAVKKLQSAWGTGQTGVLTVSLLERMLSDTSVQISMSSIREYLNRIQGEFTEVFSFVERLYEVILERNPDAGAQTWIDLLNSGEYTGAEVVEGFLTSNEFTNKKMSNEEFVKIMYRALFGREADASGLTTWTGFLNQGYVKRFVVAGFANSDEFRVLCENYGIISGQINITLAEQTPGLTERQFNVWQFVERLYSEALGRIPDQSGMNAWTSVLLDHSYTGVQVAEGFILSDEFLNKNMSDEQFVRVMYKAFLGREADVEGLTTWTNVLNGNYTKQFVFAGFANSDEFGTLCDSYGIIQGSAKYE